jgi:hypothetical protein
VKISYQLATPELKSALELYLASLGHPVTDSDSFTLNTDGTVTVVVSVAQPTVVPPEGGTTVVTGPVVPSATLPINTTVTGRATIFGLNYDGSIDSGDNGQGFFGFNTREQSLIGASIPEEVLMATIGLTGTWAQNAVHVLQWAKTNMPMVRVWLAPGKASVLAQLVDVGPSASTGNALDRTYGLCVALGEMDNGTNTYSIEIGGKAIEIKGWPIKA